MPAVERPGLAAATVDRRKQAYLCDMLEIFPMRPHWLIETMHGFHAVFRVLPVREPAAVREAGGLTRRLVRAHRGDENAAP